MSEQSTRLHEAVRDFDFAYLGLEDCGHMEQVTRLLGLTVGDVSLTLVNQEPYVADIAKPKAFHESMLVAGVRCRNLRNPMLIDSICRNADVADEFPHREHITGSGTPRGALLRLVYLQQAYLRGLKPYPKDIVSITGSCMRVFDEVSESGCRDDAALTDMHRRVADRYERKLVDLGK